MDAKPFWTSKTLWFNLVLALAAVAETQLNVLQPLLPVNVFALLSFVLPVGNALLRVVSSTPLSLTAEPGAPLDEDGAAP